MPKQFYFGNRLLCLVSLTAALLPGPARAADLAGRATYRGELFSLPPLAAVSEQFCAARNPQGIPADMLVVGAHQGLANVLVRLVSRPAQAPPLPDEPQKEPAVLRMDGCRLAPRLLAAPQGAPLQAHNADEVLHILHFSHQAAGVAVPPGQTVALQVKDMPDKPVEVRCSLHDWERAYLAVVPHEYFAVTDQTGEYSIKGLPEGSYEIEAWHERLGARRVPVSIQNDKAPPPADLVFELGSAGGAPQESGAQSR